MDKSYFKNLLLQLRRELTGQIDQIVETGSDATQKEAAGELSSYSFHIADMGTDTMDREQNFMAVHRDGLTVQLIDEALERIEKDAFGKCIECEATIPLERLELLPQVGLCISCQKNQESRQHALDYEEEGEW